MKNRDRIQLWEFLVILGVFPIVGGICALYYHSVSMFYVSLIAVPIAAITFPLALFLMNVVPFFVMRTAYLSVSRLWQIFYRKR